MANRRMLSKSISTSIKVSRTKGLGPKLLFTWMIPHADDDGRLQGDPSYIKALVLPLIKEANEKTVETWLFDLASNGLIFYYDIDGEKYIEITQWERYNNTRNDRYRTSVLPGMTNDNQVATNGKRNLTELNLTELNLTYTPPHDHQNSKNQFLDFVWLSEQEEKTLITRIGQEKTSEMIETLNNYIEQIGHKKAAARYKSHYHVILNWLRKDQQEIERRVQVRQKLDQQEGILK